MKKSQIFVFFIGNINFDLFVYFFRARFVANVPGFKAIHVYITLSTNVGTLVFLDGGDRLFRKFVSPVLVLHKVEEDSFLEDGPKYGRFRYKVTFFEFVNKLQKRNI